MTRGVEHPAELRAQVVAAVLAGTTIAQAARNYGLSKSLVSEWAQADVRTVRTEQRARDIDLGELILGLLESHVSTIQAQLQAAARPEWLEKQSAAELAQLVAVERDTTIRLLAGLQQVDDAQRPELDAPGVSENA
jgi:hypothetical protein